MNANELMVGDWVNYHDIFNTIAPADFCHKEWLEEIKPIPLTPEILEKNGFTNNPYFKGIYIKEINKRCQITYDVDTPCLMINFRGGYVSKKDIKYLHELQHALRFIGLSDIADNLIL